MAAKGIGGAWLLSETKLFEKLQILKEGEKSGGPSSNPIIAICGEKCYAWSKPKNALIVVNTSEVFKNGNDGPLEYQDIQEWQLSQRVVFDVTNVIPQSASANAFEGSGAVSVLLWGKNGLAVVTNQNSGAEVAQPKGGGVVRFVKKTILVGEKTYIEHPRLEVIQAKWLPSSGIPSHPKIIAVLNSDNYFRFYQVDTLKGKEAISCGSVSIEPDSSATIPFINRSGRFAADLEDESVADFDIGGCLPKSKYYPLFVLRESGSVSYVLVRFVGKNVVFFADAHGVIPVSGFESTNKTATSIIVSKDFPVFVAIGFCGGLITHSIIIPDWDESSCGNGMIDDGQNVEEKFIFDGLNMIVKERLDLDFLAQYNSVHNTLKLLPDPLHSHRYVCIHDIGVHLVTAHFYPEILRFFESDHDEDCPETTTCSSQLLLRWRLGEEVKPERNLFAICFSQRKPQKIVAVLQDLKALVFELPDPSFDSKISLYVGSSGESSARAALQNGLENIFAGGSNIEENSKIFLRRTSTEPYLCSKEEIPVKELEEYVIQTIKTKSDRMAGIEEGMQYLMKTVMAMQERLKKMEELVQGLNSVRSDLQNKAETFAEAYEECVERDENHVKRLEAILSRYHHASPVVTDKEKEWIKKLEVIKNDLPDLQAALDLLKEKAREESISAPSKRDTLTETQLAQIEKELRSQSDSLNALTYSLKQISEHMYYPALMSARPNSKS